MKKLIIGIVIVLLVAVVMIAIFGSDSTPTEVATTPEVQKTFQVIKVTDLADRFDENQVAAEEEWNGKNVQFEATISNITDSGIGFYQIASDEFSMTQISCKVSDKNELLSLKNGEVVTVTGVVDGMTFGVISIDDCQVIK